MSLSYVITESESFTITHARQIASRVATDLLRFQNFYGKPSSTTIDDYEEELASLLKASYLATVTYGFKHNEKWIEAVKYRALPDGSLVADEDPGKLRPKTGIVGLPFTSYLTYSNKWWGLSPEQRRKFKEALPFRRTNGDEPEIENGYWVEDRTYGAGGRGVTRSSIRRW